MSARFSSQVNVDLPKGKRGWREDLLRHLQQRPALRRGGLQHLVLTQPQRRPRPAQFARADVIERRREYRCWPAGPARSRRCSSSSSSSRTPMSSRPWIASRPRCRRPEKWIPPACEDLDPISDRTITIRASVEDVQFSLLLSIALVVMVIFLFLRRFWPTFIASVTVPLALAGTFGGDVSAALQPGQSLAHGRDDLGRLRGG